jgi:hypothetical protein
MRALLILDYGNALYTAGPSAPPTTLAAVQAFGNFAAAAARHFAGTGTRFEVWNEPNVSSFWPPASDPAQYAALAEVAIASIHQGDPSAEVTTAGVSGFDYSFAGGFLGQGGGAGANAIGVHPYDVSNPAGDLVDNLVLFGNLLGRNLSSPPPVWDTEWGFSSTAFSPPGPTNGHDPGAQRRQAVLAAREMLSACAVGLPIYVYYDIRDDGTDQTNPEDNFGLLGNDYTDKPAMTAIRTLAAVARGRTFSGCLPMLPTSLVAMRFDGPTDQVVALWSFAPNSSVSVTVPGSTATDYLGNPIQLQNNAVTVSEANGPVYISFQSPARLTNLSVRSYSGTGSELLIAGFVITGGSKTVLVRGDGPALASFGIAGAMQDVNLVLLNSASAVIGQNNGWGGSSSLGAVFSQVGAFSLPSASLDSALVEKLGPGSYTAEVGGAGSSTGVALAEIYDADMGTPVSRLVNASARTLVGTGANVTIVGFVIGGSGVERLVVRAVGPGLSQFGVQGALSNPILTLFDSNGHSIYSNTGWGGTTALASAFATVGAFSLQPGSADSALLVSLPAGSYSAQVSGAAGGTGVALVELYEVPPGN